MPLESLNQRTAAVEPGGVLSSWLFLWLDRLRLAINGVDTRVQTTVAVTFANLPASPAEGALAIVSDSNTAVWGATIAGGGANRALAYYNGTNWTVAAI